jgi:hypothetical protein
VVSNVDETKITLSGGLFVTKRIFTLSDRQTSKQVEQLELSCWQDKKAMEGSKIECLDYCIERGL